MGASAVKLLVDYNPSAGELAERQEQLVAQVVAPARAADIPLLVEPVTYSINPASPKGSAEFAAERPHLVAETARRIGALQPDVLKLEFPHDATHVTDRAAWQDACAALDAASPVPWAVLSAGVDFETFKQQVQIACEAGASGYVAGRSFWQEAARMPQTDALAFLNDVAAARMADAAAVAPQVSPTLDGTLSEYGIGGRRGVGIVDTLPVEPAHSRPSFAVTGTCRSRSFLPTSPSPGQHRPAAVCAAGRRIHRLGPCLGSPRGVLPTKAPRGGWPRIRSVDLPVSRTYQRPVRELAASTTILQGPPAARRR